VLKPLILFAGPDGAGKSTIALLLKKYLERRGYRVKVVRIRGTHTLAYVLMLFLRDVLGLKGSDIHYYGVEIPRKLIGLWIYLEFFSLIPLILWYYIFLRIRYIVVSERSILDALIWVITSFKDTASIAKLNRFKFFLLHIIKYARCTIYITASLEILKKRKPSEEFLVRKMWIYYNMIAKVLKLSYVDTSTSHPLTTLHEVLSILQRSGCIQLQFVKHCLGRA
jgi:DNA polymerase III delta prime subunit